MYVSWRVSVRGWGICLVNRKVPGGGDLSRGKLSDLELVRGEVVPVELVLFRCLPSRELVRGEVVRLGIYP